MLSEWLHRLMFDGPGGVVDDLAVWAAPHRVAGAVDTVLPEVFAGDRAERLAGARERLRRALGDEFITSVEGEGVRCLPVHTRLGGSFPRAGPAGG